MKNKRNLPLLKPILCGSLLLSSFNSHAIDYNDPFWSSPSKNTDFVDHFATSSLNRNVWDVKTNIFVNGEDEDYQDVEYPAADWTLRSGQDDVGALDGKALNLKARYMDGAIQNYYGGKPNQGKPLLIRAGRIEGKTSDATTFTYGKFEARIKMPAAKNGEFPAWWLLGNFDDVGWTACQELDIIEFTGANATNAPQTHWSAPYPVYGGNPITTSYASLGISPSSQYVTYGVIKTPDSADFYINGIKTYSYSRSNMGEQQPFPYVSPMHMILNHAITHVEWPDVGNYNKLSSDPNVQHKTGWTTVQNGVTLYEYLDAAAMSANIGRNGTDFLVDYVAHWPLPSTEPLQKYTDDTKYSFIRETNNTKGFYSLRGWLAPVAVKGDSYLQEGNPNDTRDNGPKNAADGYVGSKWATPKDDNLHWVEVDYGSDKLIKYLWLEWSWNLPKAYEIYGKSANGQWEYILTSEQDATGWSKHVFDINKSYRYLKLITKGRIDKSDSIWLLELMAFEDVPNVYPKPAGTIKVDRSINMLSNGTFDADLNGWIGEKFDGATPVYASVGGAASISTTNQGANNGSIQLHTQGFGLKRNHRYQVSFTGWADAPRNAQVRLSNDDLNPSASGTYLLQSLALTSTKTPYSFTLDYTASDNAGRLAFLLGAMGTSTVYIDNVIIKEVSYIGVGDPLVPALDTSNFVSASSGWETQWWGVAPRAVDGSPANKASSTLGFEGQDQWIKVQIDPNYQVKEVWVAGDKSAPRSLDQFKVDYGTTPTNMVNWTPSNTDGTYESVVNFSNTPPAGERDFTFWFRPPAGQLVEVADIQLMAVDNRPHRIYTIGLDDGGAITPAGILRYSKNNTDSATYTFTPPSGKVVSNVIVDGTSLGALASYTFTNINKNHTLAVAYSIGQAQPSLLSANHPTFASSQLQAANNAVDGNSNSRWESLHGITPSWLSVDLGAPASIASVVIDWEAANASSYRIEGSNDNQTWTTLKAVTGGTFGARTDTHNLSGTYRYIRIFCSQASVGNTWGYSIYELKVYGVGGAKLPSAQPIVAATASSAIQPALFAADKLSSSRWESAFNVDPSWLVLDLGSSKDLSRVEIDWEAANASNYLIQGSNDNTQWTNLASVTGGVFGNRTDTTPITGSYRYIRLYCTQRSIGNQWGYSIWEVRIIGN